MRTVHVGWLGECPNCGFDRHHRVRTEGCEFELFEKEQVQCGYCSHPGQINKKGKVEWKK